MSDPEVPTLADAAQAIVDWWDKQGTVVEPWQKIERLRAALGQREPDTPAEDERAAWERMDRVIDGANPTLAAPATPEGGELDDLLARWDEREAVLQRTKGPGVHWSHDERFMRDLASALRSQRGVLIATRGDRAFIEGRLEAQRDENDRLERELAEVRDTRELLDIASIGAWLMEHRGWDSADVDELDEALRAVVVRAAEDKETP